MTNKKKSQAEKLRDIVGEVGLPGLSQVSGISFVKIMNAILGKNLLSPGEIAKVEKAHKELTGGATGGAK